MKIVKLDKEEDSQKVTVELSLREMNVIRDILNRSVVLDEKVGLILNRFTKALIWQFNCIRNIAANGMIGPGDALDWVDKLAERVQEADSKAKVEAKMEARVSESARAAGFKKLQINDETGEITREEAPKKQPAPGSFREALQPCPFCEVKHD